MRLNQQITLAKLNRLGVRQFFVRIWLAARAVLPSV